MLKECSHCGAKSPDEATKCQWCGKEFSDSLEKIPANTLPHNEQKIDEKNSSDTKKSSWQEFKEYLKKLQQGDEQSQGKSKGLFVRDKSQEIDAMLVRLMQKKLDLNDCIFFACIPSPFLVILLIKIFPDLFSQPYMSIPIKILIGFLIISINFMIFGWFFSKNRRDILTLGSSVIAGLFITSIVSYIFDKVIGFNKESLPPPDAVLVDPGTYPGLIVGLLAAFIMYKMLKKGGSNIKKPH